MRQHVVGCAGPNRGSLSVRHTRNAAPAVEQAQQVLGLTWPYVYSPRRDRRISPSPRARSIWWWGRPSSVRVAVRPTGR